MPVPIPAIPQLTPSGPTGVGVAPGVAQQPANSLGALGRQLMQAGAQAGDIVARISKVNDLKHKAEFDLSVYERQQELLQGLTGDFNEESWVGDAESAMEDLYTSYPKEHLSPEGRRELDLEFRRQKATFTNKVGSMAIKQSQDRALEAGMLSLQAAVDSGDLAEYNRKADALGAVLSPEKIEALKAEGKKRIVENELKKKARIDPNGVIDEVEAGKYDYVLDQDRLNSVLYAANREQVQKQRKTFHDVMLAMELGDKPSVEQVMNMVDDLRLDANMAAGLIENIKSSRPVPLDVVKYSDLMSDLNTYDPNKDDASKRNLAALEARVALSGIEGPAMTRLRNELLDLAEGDRPGSVSSRIRSDIADILSIEHSRGAFGAERDNFGNITDESNEKSKRNMMPIQDAMDRFYDANPDATRADAIEHLDSLLTPYKETMGASAILGSTPVVMATKTSYGYPDDPYDDTNSLRGIGHDNNRLTPGVSVALSRETATKLGIKGKERVTLEAAMPDGSVREVTYDDTIPSDYSEDRIDFYSPDKNLRFDGELIKIRVKGSKTSASARASTSTSLVDPLPFLMP